MLARKQTRCVMEGQGSTERLTHFLDALYWQRDPPLSGHPHTQPSLQRWPRTCSAHPTTHPRRECGKVSLLLVHPRLDRVHQVPRQLLLGVLALLWE